LFKKALLCSLVIALVGIFVAPASAQILPEAPPKGQPAISGELERQGVIHCQPIAELFTGLEFAPGTLPGGIVVLPSGEWKYVGPEGKLCPTL